MSCKIIIFGAGYDGREALDFFGINNVFCFVDNNHELAGKTVKGINILSFAQLVQLYQENPLFSKNAFEVVIAISFNRWAVHSVASKLKKANIKNFSIFIDVKRRWKSGREFLQRDKDVYPCEQEYIQKISLAQHEWLLRHTNPTQILPAVGKMRESQLKSYEFMVELIEEMERELHVKPFMIAGTLLGAVRHRGCIPWDDDADFGATSSEYKLIYDFLIKRYPVYEFEENGYMKINSDAFPNDDDFDVIVVQYCNVLSVRHVVHPAPAVTNNPVGSDYTTCVDFFSHYFYPESYTQEQFLTDCEMWRKKAEYLSSVSMTKMWDKETEDKEKHPDYSKVITTMSMIYYVMLDKYYSYNERGKKYLRLLNTEDIFPLKKLKFENSEFYAPNNPDAFLSKVYGSNYMELPATFGAPVHDKDAIFSEIY